MQAVRRHRFPRTIDATPSVLRVGGDASGMEDAMRLTIVSPDCEDARRLEALVRLVLEKNQLDADVENVQKLGEIEQWPITHTPALACNGKLLMSGRIPTAEELEFLLTSAAVV